MPDGFVINDTTYAGEAASQFIVKAITGADTIQGGNVYVKDGIKKKFTIPRWDATYTDFIQDRQATPVSKGSSVIDGQVLLPEDYMIYYEFNPRDFEDHWFATQLDETLIDRSLPVSVESVVVQEVLKRHAKYFNQMLWVGDMTTNGVFKYFDGFIRKAKLASDTIVVSSPTTLTASNIQGEFLRGYQGITPALRYDPAMKFFCSYATYDLYATSQINQTYKGVDITQEGVKTFKGRVVEKIADFPDNTYLIAKGLPNMESNLWVGMNSTDDANLKLEKKQANSELYFVKMLMKADVQIGWNNETVYYGA
ncbi:hypothetical protein [Mucilaginibacter sp. 10I4]|uniref:hypothetical protein n=1 Tax=Mucilaginibacter sp. 10I4 TaxID=3048580 RepID=UPI002B230C7D|nr:hypothetical protein [Mucilaginibacter sp. 10I4]MEB0264075.1 hypothetical protein [Mucilaginibacter sp. 10I4]